MLKRLLFKIRLFLLKRKVLFLKRELETDIRSEFSDTLLDYCYADALATYQMHKSKLFKDHQGMTK